MADSYGQFELMLPVGDREMFHAAVENGANAVYFGVPRWNARGRTIDFSFDDVREMIRYARIRNVRTFLAMNILVFEEELDSLPDFIEDLAALKPDAIIVQDVGLVRLFQKIAPEIEIHASTQMTIASAEGVEMARRLGCTRAVLARELSLQGIQKIAERSSLELEVFVHGALCVSFSGQCLTSENFGGRSANRGQCAQSCRLPYKIFLDGKPFDSEGKKFLFSPRDLCAIDDIDELKRIGIKSFKVEGRLKSSEYVAAATRAFREKIDAGEIMPQTYEPLEVLFSRGLGHGWLHGIDQQKLVNGYYSNHHGEFLGKVEKISRQGILVSGEHHLYAGDGILFEEPGEENSCGSRLFSSKPFHGNTLLEFGKGFDLRKIRLGADAFRNDSPATEKALHKTFADRENALQIPIDLSLAGIPGENLRLNFDDRCGHAGTVQLSSPIVRAEKESENFARIHKALSALTGTAYRAENVRIDVAPNAFILDKDVRTLRKQAVEKLDEMRFGSAPVVASAADGKALIAAARSRPKKICGHSPEITILVRRPEQLEHLTGVEIDRIVLDLDWGVDVQKPLERIRSMGLSAGIATLRVLKEGETSRLKKVAELEPDFILVRNPGALAFLQKFPIPLAGDYSLNVSNSLTAEWFLSEGLESLHPSLDLNVQGTLKLFENFGGERFEVSVFEHLPAFYMEYCPYAANLTQAERFPYCKQICSKHRMDILDHKGELHTVVPDAECRNTLYLGSPQSALSLVPEFRRCGVYKFRLEMLDESAEEVADTVNLYASALKGKIPLEQAIRKIGAEERYGVSEGQLFHTDVWKDRKKSGPKSKRL